MTNALGSIPTLDKVQPGVVENAAAAISKAGAGIRGSGDDVASTWKKLGRVYEAPEAGKLFSAIMPIRDQTDRFGWEVGQVGAALSDFAAEIAPVKAKLEALKAAADVMALAQAATPGGESHWRRKQSNVDAENKLLHEVGVAWNQAHEIAAKCANRINGLYGGVQYHSGRSLTDDPGDFWASDPSDLSWGKPVQRDWPWYDDLWHGTVGIAKGIVVDGGGGLIKGLGALAGFGPGGWKPSTLEHTWGTLGVMGLATFTPAALTVPFVRHTVVKAQVGMARDFLALDEWKKDKGRALGKVVFNAITLGIPESRLGLPGRAGDAAIALTRGVNKVDVVGHGLNLGFKGAKAGINAFRNVKDLGDGLAHLPKIDPGGIDHLPVSPEPHIDPGHFHVTTPETRPPEEPPASSGAHTPHDPTRPSTDAVHGKPTVRDVVDRLRSKHEHSFETPDQKIDAHPKQEPIKVGARPHKPGDINAHASKHPHDGGGDGGGGDDQSHTHNGHTGTDHHGGEHTHPHAGHNGTDHSGTHGDGHASDQSHDSGESSGPPWHVADGVSGSAHGKSLNPPHSRHTISGAKHGKIGPRNSVFLRGYERDINKDVAQIAEGKARWNPQTNRYEINGRTYGVEPSGTVFPDSGVGIVKLDRNEYAALKELAKAGGDPAKVRDFSKAPRFVNNPGAIEKAKAIYDGTYKQ